MTDVEILYTSVLNQLTSRSSSQPVVNLSCEAALSSFGRHLMFHLDDIDLVYESDGETLQAPGEDAVDSEALYALRLQLFVQIYTLYTKMISTTTIPKGFRGYTLFQKTQPFAASTNRLATLLEDTLTSYILETHTLHPRQLLFSACGTYRLDSDHLDFCLKNQSQRVYEVRAVFDKTAQKLAGVLVRLLPCKQLCAFLEEYFGLNNCNTVLLASPTHCGNKTIGSLLYAIILQQLFFTTDDIYLYDDVIYVAGENADKSAARVATYLKKVCDADSNIRERKSVVRELKFDFCGEITTAKDIQSLRSILNRSTAILFKPRIKLTNPTLFVHLSSLDTLLQKKYAELIGHEPTSMDEHLDNMTTFVKMYKNELVIFNEKMCGINNK